MQFRLRPAALAFAVSTVLAVASAPAALAQALTLPLSGLDGTTGLIIDGEAGGDAAGRSVSAAGDINGDGIDDLIIGADTADPNGLSSGSSYVLFGRSGGFASPLPLLGLDGSNGFRLHGEAASDLAGGSVSAAGDVNGDGFDDLIIGASGANAGDAGRSYVVFGRGDGFPASLQFSSLDGSNGFAIDGELAGDGAGFAVGAAGDFNADGIDDLLVTARSADPNGNDSGRVYVVFGRISGFASPLPLSSLDGLNGLAINGEGQGAFTGRSAKAAGDINGDGIDDVVIGANNASNSNIGNPRSGRAYVVFGSSAGFATPLQLANLNGTLGFAINGEFAGDQAGVAVSGAGDINGDGLDDLIIGASGADPRGEASGQSYVVFGRDTGFAAVLNLSSLDGSTGFALAGEAGHFSGSSVSAAGDINGDGVDDLLVGAPGAGPERSGRSHVVFGSRSPFPARLALSALDGEAGFALDGELDSSAGTSVSRAGDLNADGVDDLVVGAPGARLQNGRQVGRAYVVFGVRSVQAPAAPVIGLATAGDAHASISFTAGSDGGSPITGFTATSTPEGLSSVDCVASPCIVDGLSNGTAYIFIVTASNAIGTSPASLTSNAVVPKGDQSVSFGTNPGPLVFAGASAAVTAVASSGLPVRFASTTPAVCSVDASSGLIGLLAAGACVISADQDGNAAFNPAPQVTQSVAIERAPQTISFGPPPSLNVGDSGDLSVSGGASGNAVLLSSQTPEICSISGVTVAGLAHGSCVIAANQAGNDNFLAASEATLTLAVIGPDALFSDGFEATP
jgi:hypothetical protein